MVETNKNIPINIVSLNEPDYHPSFYTLQPKPKCLWYQGNLALLDKKILGVVGPRKPSVYAEQVMFDFFKCVSEYDLVTISGGATGVDTMCHELSLKYNHPTIMILGAGFDYYLMHQRTKDLLRRIVEHGGLILSQFPNDHEATPRSFPARNKIIAGLSDVVFVPAAGNKSGSLLTVDFAVKMGTPIYSVPNSIYDATSEGTIRYIVDGKIHPITEFEKMLNDHFTKIGSVDTIVDTTKVPFEISLEEQQLLELLAKGPLDSTEICQQLQRPIEKLLGVMTGLEMQGMTTESQPGTYEIT